MYSATNVVRFDVNVLSPRGVRNNASALRVLAQIIFIIFPVLLVFFRFFFFLFYHYKRWGASRSRKRFLRYSFNRRRRRLTDNIRSMPRVTSGAKPAADVEWRNELVPVYALNAVKKKKYISVHIRTYRSVRGEDDILVLQSFNRA